MRRSDLVESVNQLIEALHKSDMNEAMLKVLQSGQKLGTSQNSPLTEILLGALSIFSLEASRFNEPTKNLLRIFNLDELTNPAFWAAAVSENGLQLVNRSYQALSRAEGFLPLIIKMLETDTDRIDSVRASEHSYKDAEILSVFIVENEHEYSDVGRITHLLDAVSTLYDVCAEVNGDKPDKLRLIGCDSGSDKSFDFLGHGKTIECVKDTFFQLWDRIAFYKERRSSEQIKTVIEALPGYEHIGDLEQKEKIDHDTAERLRHKLDTSLEKFYNSGAYIAEAKDRIHYDARQIAAPERKLLTGTNTPSDHQEQVSPTESFSVAGLTVQQQDILLAALRTESERRTPLD